jgi:hypothetical protein
MTRTLHVRQTSISGPLHVDLVVHRDRGEIHSLAQARAFAAIVDLRAGATFGRIETFELNPGNAIFVPPHSSTPEGPSPGGTRADLGR